VTHDEMRVLYGGYWNRKSAATIAAATATKFHRHEGIMIAVDRLRKRANEYLVGIRECSDQEIANVRSAVAAELMAIAEEIEHPADKTKNACYDSGKEIDCQ